MLLREEYIIRCVFYISGWSMVTISGVYVYLIIHFFILQLTERYFFQLRYYINLGQAIGQLQKAVLCKNGSDYFTINCGQSSSHFPAFINIVTVPRLIYSERLKDMYMSGIVNCPSQESEIAATCQRETTTPINRLELSSTCYTTFTMD